MSDIERELKDTRDELEVYRLASETAVYEASQFDRGLFLSGDRGVEDVMRRVLEALKVARSEATQAKAQAAFVAAERDQLRQELAEARHNVLETNKSDADAMGDLAQLLLTVKRERDTAQADARQLAKALNDLTNDIEKNGDAINYGPALELLEKHGARYLEQP